MLKIDRSGYEHFFALFCMFTLKKNERKAKPFQSDTWNSEETDVGRVDWWDNTSLDTGMAMNTITDLDNLVLDASPNQQPVHITQVVGHVQLSPLWNTMRASLLRTPWSLSSNSGRSMNSYNNPTTGCAKSQRSHEASGRACEGVKS